MKLRQRFLMPGEDRPRKPMPVHEFSTTEELLALPYLQSMAREPGFLRFEKADENLVQVMRDTWAVVGQFDTPDEVDLPEWHARGGEI
jgi:hypothetical protein